MYEPFIAWAGLALGLLLVLCLPFPGVKKLVLGAYALVVRLAVLALVGAAVYLWFRPGELPVMVTDMLNSFPLLLTILPEPGTQNFGISAAALVVALLLPLLAVLDVSRNLAGWRVRHPRVLAASPGAEEPLAPPPAPQQAPSRAPRRIDRRAAADAMAQAGSRKPSHAADRLEQ